MSHTASPVLVWVSSVQPGLSAIQVTLKMVFLDGSFSSAFSCMYALANANVGLSPSRIFGISFGAVTVDVSGLRIEDTSNPGELACAYTMDYGTLFITESRAITCLQSCVMCRAMQFAAEFGCMQQNYKPTLRGFCCLPCIASSTAEGSSPASQHFPSRGVFQRTLFSSRVWKI